VTVRNFVSACGWLVALVIAITQYGCATTPKVPTADEVRAKVHAIVEHARAATGESCEKALPACAAYYEAVKAGLVPDDDRAEVACAGVATVCELASGAPAH